MKDLAKIIKKNPGCIAEIDNDSWRLLKGDEEPEGFDEWSYAKQDRWLEKQVLARSSDYEFGNCYGSAILYALAKVVGIRVEGV